MAKRRRRQPTYESTKRSTFSETWFVVVAVILALGLLLYPTISTQWNNYRQYQVSDAYSKDVETLGGEAEEVVKKAEEYNERNAAGPIIDAWNSRVAKDNKVYQEYVKELHTLDAMSELIIPKINVNLPVFHGTEDATLQKGLGHLFGTALPVGGKNTHAVVTGHSGMPNATMFDNLPKMEVGDVIYVNTYGKKMKYQVYDIEVVLPEETDSLWPDPNRDLLTLITCTPYGVNSHRLLVHAQRVPLEEQDEEKSNVTPFVLQWWMVVFLIAAALALEALIIWVWVTHKRIKSWNAKVERMQRR